MDRKAEIEKIAHQLWIERGRPVGDPMTDWAAAERIVNGQGAQAPQGQPQTASQPQTAGKSGRRKNGK